MVNPICKSVEKMKALMEEYKWPGIMNCHVEHARAIHSLAKTVAELLKEKHAKQNDHKSLLEEMGDERIFSIQFEGGKFSFWECCDNYFHHEITPEQFDRLIEEMREFRKAHT